MDAIWYALKRLLPLVPYGLGGLLVKHMASVYEWEWWQTGITVLAVVPIIIFVEVQLVILCKDWKRRRASK